MNDGHYTLYGAHFSYYSGKVRAYLQKKNIPFVEKPATLKVYKNIILPNTGVAMIPVVQTPAGNILQDSTVIIDELEQHFDQQPVYPHTPLQKLVALLIETWADEWLVMPAMHYRWNFPAVNQPYIFSCFGSLVMPKMPTFVRAWLGKRIGRQFKGAVPKLGISKNSIPFIEASYMALMAELDAHFDQHTYVLGDRPSIADYGLIGPLFAHLYHDPYPGRLMCENAPQLTAWVERMIDGKPASGDFLPNDEIPATLLPVLKRLADEQLPTLLDIDRQLSVWRQNNTGKKLPRSIGMHEFTLVNGDEQCIEKRFMFPYSLWMHQRAVDHYQSLNNIARQHCDELAEPLGISSVLQQGVVNRLERHKHKIRLAE